MKAMKRGGAVAALQFLQVNHYWALAGSSSTRGRLFHIGCAAGSSQGNGKGYDSNISFRNAKFLHFWTLPLMFISTLHINVVRRDVIPGVTPITTGLSCEESCDFFVRDPRLTSHLIDIRSDLLFFCPL